MLQYFKISITNPLVVLCTIVALSISNPGFSATIYVKWNASGSNNGSSWFNAYTNLSTAISSANSGDEIWVAAGTYKPTSGTNRAAAFSMKDGVAIYGGFAGNESSLGQRNIASNVTILSGDIGTIGNKNDNSIYLIVNDNNGLTNTAILDGFTLKDTYYNISLDPHSSRCAGVFNHHVTPTIRNCTFEDLLFENNSGGFHSYLFNKDNLSLSAPSTRTVIDHCRFIGNKMDGNFEQCYAIVSQLSADITNSILNNFAEETNSSVRTDGIFLGHIPNETRPDLYFNIKNNSMFNSSLRLSSYDPIMHVTIEECTMLSFAKWLWAPIVGQVVTSASEPCCTAHNVTIKNSTIHIPCHNNQVWLGGASSVVNETISYSNLMSVNYSGPCTGCINNDEPHVEITNGELDFFASSPGINDGQNTGVYSVDLNDNPRIHNSTVDMGAYELQVNTLSQVSPVTSVSGTSGSGPTVQVTASGGGPGTLVWYNTMGQVVGTGNPVNLPVSSSIEYGYYVRYENGNQASDFYCFTTTYCNSPTEPSLSPTSATVCTGGTTTVTASGSGVTYYWYSGSCGGTFIGTGTSQNLGAGTYYVRAYDASKPSCPWSTCATVTISAVSSPPTPTANPNTTTICNGSTTTVTASGSGSGVTYYWYSNSCGSGSLGTGNSKNLGPGTYYVRAYKASNPSGCQWSSCDIITINGVNSPNGPTLTPSSATICTGNTTTVVASGGSGTYYWYSGSCGGTSLGTGSSKNLGPGTYYVRVFDSSFPSGCQWSSCASVTITGVSAPSAPTVSPNPTTVCQGTSATVSASGSGSGIVYYWYSGSCGGTSLGTGTSQSLPAGTYYVRAYKASNPSGCQWSGCTTVTINSVNAPTTPSLSAAASVCAGASTTVTASGSGSGAVYHWYSGSSCSGTSLGTGTTMSLGAGTYSVNAVISSNPSGCQWSSCATITIASINAPNAPSLTPSADTVCTGGSASVTASGGGANATYEWFTVSCGGTPYATGPTQSLPAGTYYVRIYDSSFPGGCQYSVCTPITIHSVSAPASPSISPNPASVCAGDSATLTASGSGIGIVYYWYSNSCGSGSLGTGSSKKLPAGTYYVRAFNPSNPSGCQWSSCTTVNVNSSNAPSTPVLTANDDSICTGNTTTINVQSPVSGLTYYWYSGSCGGALLGTGTSQTYGPGTYYVQSQNNSNPLGCQWSSCATITIYGINSPSKPTLSALADTICSGSTTTVTASGSGSGVAYSWYSGSCNGTLIGTGNSLVVSPGTYYVIASDINFPSGCQNSPCDSITIDSFTAPSDPILNTIQDTVCIGDSTSIIVSNSSPGVIYYWYSGSCGSTIIGTGTSQTLPAGTYYVQAYNVSNPNGCQWSGCSSISIYNHQLPPIPVGVQNYAICQGDSLTMTVNSIPGITYNWYDNPQGNPPILGAGSTYTASPTSNTTYYVFASNSNCLNDTALDINVVVNPLPAIPSGPSVYDLCIGSPLTLHTSAGLGDTLIWSYDSTFASQIGIGDSIVVSPTSDTVVYVMSNNGTCLSGGFLSIQIDVHDLPTSNHSVIKPSCLNVPDGAIIVSGSSQNLPLAINWSNGGSGDSLGGLSSGQYIYTITDSKGCSSSDSALVAPADSINPIITGNNVICEGDSLMLVVLSNKGIDFDWGNGIKNDTIVLSPSSDTVVSVTVLNVNKCMETDSVFIQVQPKPDATIFGPDSICSNEFGLFSVAYNGTYSYNWNTGSIYDTTYVHGNDTLSQLSVTVTDQNGCRATSSRSPIFLAKFSSPIAGIDTSIDDVYLQNVQFYDASSGGISSWSWDFGDGDFATDKDPYHIYDGPGNYEIWLHVTDDNGCRDSASIELQVEEYIIIPNVFSPNGDGFNDFFEIPNTGMKEFELTIFNRWGTLLYNTTSANVRWDGRTLSGRMVSEDTYYFELKAVGSEDYSTTGYIMVLF